MKRQNPGPPLRKTGALGKIFLLNEHAVTIGIETIALGDGVSVGTEDELASGKSGDQHEQGGTGEMEVGEQGGDDTEVVSRINKDIGFARDWGDLRNAL